MDLLFTKIIFFQHGYLFKLENAAVYKKTIRLAGLHEAEPWANNKQHNW